MNIMCACKSRYFGVIAKLAVVKHVTLCREKENINQ